MKFTCKSCGRAVDETAHAYFFNHLHGQKDLHKGYVVANRFSESCLCPACFEVAEMRRDVESVCANFTGLHTRVNLCLQKIESLAGRVQALEYKGGE